MNPGSTQDGAVGLTITQAADRVGVAASTLRYWEQRGLLTPARRNGHRHYEQGALRRAALLKLAGATGLPLTQTVKILDGDPEHRADHVDAELQRLHDLIDRARAAQLLLVNARECTHSHPASQCPSLQDALDQILDGQEQSLYQTYRRDLGPD